LDLPVEDGRKYLANSRHPWSWLAGPETIGMQSSIAGEALKNLQGFNIFNNAIKKLSESINKCPLRWDFFIYNNKIKNWKENFYIKLIKP
jgi:hypothetical protein